MNKKILLLNPPTAAYSSEPLLNMCYLAEVLRDNNFEVLVLDGKAPFKSYSEEDILNLIKNYNPLFIGITLTISNIKKTYDFIKKLKKLNFPLVAGGPHPNARPYEILSNEIDIVCDGEGEITIIELANYFLNKTTLDDIKGIYYKKNNEFIFTGKRTLIRNLDQLPMPNFDDFPIKNYTGTDDPNSNPLFWSIFSSRGCPFNCTFCSSHNVFGRKTRHRSAENIFFEIKSLYDKYKIKNITFQDDEILSNKKRFKGFCQLMIESKLDIKMSIRTRIDSIDPEILAYAKKSNISRISFGIESFDDETLLKINKMYDVNTIHKHFKYLSDVQPLHISFNTIIGFPWENKNHYKNIINEIKKLPKNIKFYITAVTPIPYPDTKLYNDYHEEYQFTDWWLDENRNHLNSENTDPFFKSFVPLFKTLYNKDLFWNYNKKQEQEIIWYSWEVFKIFLKKHLNIFEYLTLYLLCRISHYLWKKNRKIEETIFSNIKKLNWFKTIKNKITFSKQ